MDTIWITDFPGHLGWFKKERIWIFHTAVNKPGRILGIFLKINPSPWDDSQRNAYNALFCVVFQAHRTRTFETETVWNRWENTSRFPGNETYVTQIHWKRRTLWPRTSQRSARWVRTFLHFQKLKKNMFSWWWVSTQPGPLSTKAVKPTVKTTAKVSCFKRLRLVTLKFSHELPTSPHASYVRPKHRHPRC